MSTPASASGEVRWDKPSYLPSTTRPPEPQQGSVLAALVGLALGMGIATYAGVKIGGKKHGTLGGVLGFVVGGPILGGLGMGTGILLTRKDK